MPTVIVVPFPSPMPGASAAGGELAIQRRNTEAFIAADPETVVLHPFTRQPNGSGGYKTVASPPRPPQTMRLIPISTTAFERGTLDGEAVTPEFVLLGEWDCAMSRGDKFVLDGKRYEVVHVQEKRDYQTKGETVYRGAE